MTSQERERMAIACCLICTLAEVMKDCSKCPFKKGLEVKEAQAKQNTVFLTKQEKGE